MQAFNPVQIAGPTHTQRVKGNPHHITTDDEYQSYIDRYNKKAQVYVGLNPVKPNLKGFPTDKDVQVWCNELLDLDLEKSKLVDDAVPDGHPKESKHYAAREDDLKKLEPFIDHINKWLADRGFETGYQDHTGNGCRWILPIPGLDLTGHDLKVLAAKKKEFKERIARECGIISGCGVHLDSVFDFRRITGVPGTLNFKLETETRKNRVREPFRGMERKEDAALRDHILNITLPEPEPQPARHSQTGNTIDTLNERLSHDGKLQRLYGGDITGYESRSNAEFALCCKLAFYRFTESEAAQILLSSGIGKAAEKKTSGHDAYIANTVAKAFSVQVERIGTVAPAPTQRAGFDVSPDAFLVGDRNTFDPNTFAKWLIDASGKSFATLSDTGEVTFYDSGVYQSGGDVDIAKTVEQVMDGFKITKNAVNEVIGHVQRRTYVERGEFDADKNIINLANGLYDTGTNELKPHTATYLSTVQIPIAYDPDATCPAIDRFLSDVLDSSDIPTVLEWFGYLLEPSYWIQKMLMLLGEGENGKSKFLGLLEAFLGASNCVNESIHQLANNRFRVAGLYGKLANIHADISDRELTDTGILKLLSGGDQISAEEKGKAPFKFKNFARLIFSANRLPRARDDTDAWHRRWTFVNFTRKFGSDPEAVKKADKKILEKLTIDSELSGLLNHALKALAGLHARDGFSRNLSTEETRKIYTRLSDPVAVFIEDCCMIDPSAAVSKSALFGAYVEFCRANRQASIGQTAFTGRIRDMGKFTDCKVGGKGNQVRGWRGVNIDESIMNESIFDPRCKSLGSTLRDGEETHTSDADSTGSTSQNPSLANNEQKGTLNVNVGEIEKKSVLPVLPAPTDTDSGGSRSVLPPVLPDSPSGLAVGTEIMRLIAEHDKKYCIESDRTYSLVRARIEDQGYDPELVGQCIKRYREGHRIHMPAQVIP
jgi:putative DNA primase/helicase